MAWDSWELQAVEELSRTHVFHSDVVCCCLAHGMETSAFFGIVDATTTARWKPQEEGVKQRSRSFPLITKPRFNRTSRTLMGIWKANGRKSHKAISDH